MQQLFCDENLVWMILVNVARLDEAGKKMFLFGTFAWGRTEKWKDLKHARRRDLVRHVSQRQSIRMNLLSSREHTKRKKRRSRIFRSTITNQHELKNNTNHQSEWHKTFHGETTKIKILSHKKLRRASPTASTAKSANTANTDIKIKTHNKRKRNERHFKHWTWPTQVQ